MNELALYIDSCMIQKYLMKNNISEYIHYDIWTSMGVGEDIVLPTATTSISIYEISNFGI